MRITVESFPRIPTVFLNTGSWSRSQYQELITTHTMKLKCNQEIFGYSYNTYESISVRPSCQANLYVSSQSYKLSKTDIRVSFLC